MSVIVARLHSCQAVRLQVTSNLTADAIGREQRFDAGPNPLQLKPLDRIANNRASPSRHRADADRLLATRRRARERPFSLQDAQILARLAEQRNLMWTRSLTRSTFLVKYGQAIFCNICPTKAYELLDALSASQQVQPQDCGFVSRTTPEQLPV